MNLKRQTTISLIWSGIDKVGYQVIALAVGIITARLLTPTDFGYIAALALFTTLSNILVESGFTTALVRRAGNTNAEYTAAFIFNIAISILFYIILFISAPAIAAYFKMPPLCRLARVIFTAIICNAFCIIPNIILTKALKFKQIAIADLTGMLVSSVITVVMAVKGYGYWAIAAQQVSIIAVKAIILCTLCNWRPQRQADFHVIKDIFSFSSVLILSSVISNTVKYIYNFYIGPRYPSEQLGYYGQAYKFHQIPPIVISSTLIGVAYPVFSQLNDQPERQMAYIHKIMRITAFITFPTMIGLYAISPNFISVVITDKWMPMLPHFKLLLITGITIPFYSLTQNILNTIGRPKTNFTIELVRNILIISLLLILNDTIHQMLIGYLLANYISLAISSIAVQRYIGYSVKDQLLHIAPSLILSIIMGITILSVDKYLDTNVYTLFFLQLAIGIAVYAALAWGLKLQIMKDITNIFIKRQI